LNPRYCHYCCRDRQTTAGGATAGGAATGEDEEALSDSFESFSASLAEEVDRRIAAARLQLQQPLNQPGVRPQRHSLTQQQAWHVAEGAAVSPALPPVARQPLGRLQQYGTAARGAARKRDRSPISRSTGAEDHAAVIATPQAQNRAASAQPPTQVHSAAAPASKRQKPHLAFGSRCNAPRSAGHRSGKTVRLRVEGAPAPPRLPPAEPAVAAPARKAGAGGPVSAAAAVGSTVPIPDLLRSLGAVFAARGSGTAHVELEEADGPLGSGDADAAAAGTTSTATKSAAAASGELASLLSDVTAALQALHQTPHPGSSHQGGSRSSRGSLTIPGSISLQADLQAHGVGAAEVQDIGRQLQVSHRPFN
jgi:hypothetical protein